MLQKKFCAVCLFFAPSGSLRVFAETFHFYCSLKHHHHQQPLSTEIIAITCYHSSSFRWCCCCCGLHTHLHAHTQHFYLFHLFTTYYESSSYSPCLLLRTPTDRTCSPHLIFTSTYTLFTYTERHTHTQFSFCILHHLSILLFYLFHTPPPFSCTYKYKLYIHFMMIY